MEKPNTNSDKLFLGFGILTIISGIALIFEEQYLIGISGSIVGLGLALQNFKKIKNNNIE